MPIRDLKAQIARLPEQPGVYLYYNEAGETLYVGKARVLRDRVRSYLGAHPEITHVIITAEGAVWPDMAFRPTDRVLRHRQGWGIVTLGP